MGHLTVIGTGHVFRIADDIHQAIEALRPDAVFVELDPGRLRALLARDRGETQQGKGSFVHKRLQKFQEGVAGMYGAEVGSEMVAAVRAAHAVGAKIHLIDPPAEDTLKRVMKEMTWRERGRLVGQLVKGSASQLLPGRKKRGQADVEAEIKKYQEDPAHAMAEIQKTYPTVYRIVIDERDEKMAGAIAHAMQEAEHGVAVLGDGHVDGILRRLADQEKTVYRLQDVRAGNLPKPAPVASGDTESVGFGFDVTVG